MVIRWVKAGMRLDENVRHPFTPWAKTVGGILMVNGFQDFLANYGNARPRRSSASGLAVLGAARPDEWLRPEEWAKLVGQLGLVKTIIPVADQENATGHARGIGVVFLAHRKETFEGETQTHKVRLTLEKARRRSDGGEACVKYRFSVSNSEEIPLDDMAEAVVATAKATTSKPKAKKSRKGQTSLGQPTQKV